MTAGRGASRCAAVAAALVTVLVTGCSSGSQDASGAQDPTGIASATTPVSSSPSPVATPLPSPTATVPPSTRTTLPPAPIDRVVPFGGGVSVDVTRTKAITVTGKGPGQLSGAAVAVTLTVKNESPHAIDVTSSVVAAFYGDAVPANESSSSPSHPLRGTVKPHGSVTGTYVFLIPVEQRKRVHLSISYTPTEPVVSLVGDLR
jgi:hypothetical protein